MRRVGIVAVVLAALIEGGCYQSHLPQVSDAGGPRDAMADARRGDADILSCVPGSVCDCRAALPVPAGLAWVGYGMSCDGPLGDVEGCAQRVMISREYWMNTYEVTAECYRLCIHDGACVAPTIPLVVSEQPRWDLPDAYWNDPTFGRRPIAFVEHSNATAYCSWLSGRLPTNAEWEKMARGDDGRAFPWAAPPADPRGVFSDGAMVFEIELHAHNPHGLTFDDMSPYLLEVDAMPSGRGVYGHFNVIGNVTEWVADWFRNPAWPSGVPLVNPRNDVPSEFGHLARSAFGPAWTSLTPEFNGWPGAGIRCAFDTAPEPMLVE